MYRSRIKTSSQRRNRQLRMTDLGDRTSPDRRFRAQFEVLEERRLLSAVVGRHVFYNQSSFDGNSAAINPVSDNAAIATDKTPYIPNGATATFSNITSFSRGINGIMVDLDAGENHAAITASDFVFTVGNNNTPGSWAAAPAPSAMSVVLGGGVGGSDRVIITWANGSISNKWLEVQVKSNGNTGLVADDRFFWGNKIGDAGSTSPPGLFETTSTDAAQVFATIGVGKPITDLRDYNRDGAVTTTDAAIVFASIGVIPRINIAAPPVVSLTTLVTFGDDLTPHVTITASSALGLADGTQVVLDVDINNDGDFDDPGELARTTSTLYQGGSYFELTPALPATNPVDGPYLVQLRARVQDAAGNEGTSPLSSLKIDTLGSTALFDYVNAPDASYTWSLVHTSSGPGYTYYALSMRSQTWKQGEVNDPFWDHYLKIVVPNGVLADTALLLISGGSNTSGIPTSPDSSMLGLALQTNAVTVELRIVPNEPVTFFDEVPAQSRTEDEIIAYTFDQYVNNIGQPDNETWPLLLPMVKSAVRAMDTVQTFVPTVAGGQTIDDFVVTGYSKRGWTTWLTGAVDTRVSAIIPGVIDLLNMDESMQHHYGFYDGSFAPHVGDYQEFDLIQNSFVEANQELGRIVDPYRYLFNSNLTNIPKLLLNSTGDEFFVPDSGQYYLHDLPGPSYVRYIPNTGHGLDSRAVTSTLTFLDAYLNNRTLPQFSWTAEQNGSIRVQTTTAPTQVLMWQATNLADRDFRRGFNPGINWTSSVLTDQGGGVYVGDVAVPASGARAFMIELTFPSAIPGSPYVFTTEVRVKSPVPLTGWSFYMPSNEPAPSIVAEPEEATAELSVDDWNAVAVGLSVIASPANAADIDIAMPLIVGASEPLLSPAATDSAELMFAELSWLEEEADEPAEGMIGDELELLLGELIGA